MIHKYLEKLVAYKTVEGNDSEFSDCLNWLEEFFSDRFMYTHRGVNNGHEFLVSTTQPTKKPKIMLQAHLDVVPGAEKLFSIASTEDKLVGRGVFDMKFAIAVYMQLVDKLSKKIKNYDFGIMITTDEEMGGEDGVKYLVDEWSAELCVLPDGGDNWRLEEMAKGFWLIEASATGKTAHGSRPWDGENAITKLMKFLIDAEEIFKDQSTTTPTLTIASINGGEALNQVPANAVAELDIRTTEANNHVDLIEQLEASAKKHDVKIKRRFDGDPLITDVNTAYAKSFLKHVSKVTGLPAELTQSLGSSDARYFVEKGIQVLIMRPTGGGAHSEYEWMKKSDLTKYAQLVTSFIDEHAKIN